jgi:hypothetical protein
MTLPNELWLHVFGYLPLIDLLSAYRVNQHWRSLVPNIPESIRLTFFRLAIKSIEQPSNTLHTISITDRLSYLKDIEESFDVIIPEPYRTCLTEWPIKQPPPDLHWPHSVRFHASSFCTCFREMHENHECLCHRFRVQPQVLVITNSLLEIVRSQKPFDYHLDCDDAREELFSYPPRLSTDSENDRTLDFIRIHSPGDMWSSHGRWSHLKINALRLSRYTSGEFWMMLEGPTRGEIHGWSTSTWYDGFEAKSFLDWRYEEWDPRQAAALGEITQEMNETEIRVDHAVGDSHEGGECTLSDHLSALTVTEGIFHVEQIE